MIRQSFYQLPRITQDRFIAATAGHCPPEPMLVSSVPAQRAQVVWVAASVGATLATIFALRLGYGDLSSSLALAPHYMWGVYGLLTTVSLWAAFQAFSAKRASATVPYRRARYVFPSAMIDTSDSDFRVYPLTELVSVESEGASVILVFPGGVRARFEAANADRAQATREAVISAKRTLLEFDIEGGDRARLDPLLEPRYTNPLSSRKPLVGPSSSIPLWTLPLAGLLGLLLAAGFFSVRNTLSERRLFARAVAANSPEAFRAYLARGGKRPEINNVLLPRAELLQLTQQGNLAALESYSVNNPDSSIRPEIDAALRAQLLAALANSAAEKTLGALDAFQAQHPVNLSLVRPEWTAARKALVAEAFERFAPRAAETADLVPFMKAVLAYVAEHGPLFEVRFQRVIPESSSRADELVRQDKYFREALVPSQYFVESRIEPWFEKIFQRVFRGFGLSFPTDILNVKRGQALGGSELPDSLPVPTLAISYSTNMGRGISNRNPGGMFFGVGFQFKVRLIVAGRPPLELRYSTWKPPDLLKLREDKISVSEVYDGMTNDAFKGLEGRVGNWLFKRER